GRRGRLAGAAGDRDRAVDGGLVGDGRFVPVPTSLQAVVAGAAAVAPTWSSLLGEPVAGLVILPVVALVRRASRTWAGVAVGLVARMRAAVPVTWGVAMEVPLMVVVAVSLVL